jgi:tetratricopeptide (TPR) repeat protein
VFNVGRVSESIALYALARDAFERAGDGARVAMMWRALGNAHHFAMRHDEAAAAFDRSIALASGADAELIAARVAISRSAMRAEVDGGSAGTVSEVEKALEVIERLGDFRVKLSSRVAYAAMLAQVGQHERSIDELRTCIRQAREMGSEASAADGHRMLAQSQRDLGRFDEALASAQAAVRGHSQSGNPNGLCESLSIAGDVYLRLDRPAEAVASLQQSLALVPQIEHPGMEEEILIALMQALKACGREAEIPPLAARLAAIPPDDSLHH